MKMHWKPIAAGYALCMAGGYAFAQQPPPITLGKGLTLQSEWRMRYEGRQARDFDTRTGNDPRDELSRLRLGFQWKSKDGSVLFLQPQYSYGRNTGFARATGTTDDIDIHQGFAQFRTDKLLWILGRQEFSYGDSRLIGTGNWDNVGRSFDAVRIRATDARTTTDLFVSKLGQVANKTTNPLFAGVYSTVTRNKNVQYDLYLLYKSDRVAGMSQDIWTVGTRPKLFFGKGFDATLEAAFQFGNDRTRPVEALAYAVVIGHTFPGRARLRVAIEHDYATGGNPTGTGKQRTFDNLFPTNHQHYGFADYVGWRNMRDLRLSLQAQPGTAWMLTLDVHRFGLDDARDFWYAANGRPVNGANGRPLRDPSGTAGRDLGTEIDFTVAYTGIRNLHLSGGYARFMPGSFVRNTNSGRADDADWFYMQSNWRF